MIRGGRVHEEYLGSQMHIVHETACEYWFLGWTHGEGDRGIITISHLG